MWEKEEKERCGREAIERKMRFDGGSVYVSLVD